MLPIVIVADIFYRLTHRFPSKMESDVADFSEFKYDEQFLTLLDNEFGDKLGLILRALAAYKPECLGSVLQELKPSSQLLDMWLEQLTKLYSSLHVIDIGEHLLEKHRGTAKKIVSNLGMNGSV